MLSAFITFQLLNTPADPGFGLRFRCGPVLTYARTLRVRSSRKPRRNPGLAGGQLKDLAKGQGARGPARARKRGLAHENVAPEFRTIQDLEAGPGRPGDA